MNSTPVRQRPKAPERSRRRVLPALGALVVLGVISVGYVRLASDRESDKASRAATESGLPEIAPAATNAPVAVPRPAMLTVNRSPGPEYGAVARLGPDATVTPLADLQCERVHTGDQVGACLVPTPPQDPAQLGLTQDSTELVLFDVNTGAVSSTYPVAGRPSRLRVSADGRYAGYTTFVTGHSYAVASALFSTNPVIVDTRSGVHRSIETFQVVDQDGRLIDDPTRNYWGISFAPDDSDIFYAALGIGERNYIVRGSVTGQNGAVIADGLMCPSASPDGRYLVAREQAREGRYTLFDLQSGTRQPLAEERVVDDQVEWIDDHTVSYAVARDDSPANQPVYDLWTLDIVTGERSQLALAANSPATVRQPTST